MYINVELKDLLDDLQTKYPDINGVWIDQHDIVFEERIKMNCYYCGKYNVCWKCPPKLPDLDYRKMFAEFDNAALIYLRLVFTEETFHDVRVDSSVLLHKALLDMEKFLWDHGNPTAISFIGGSCKLCKNGCGKERCNDPYRARSPIEATGVNVLKIIEKYGIDISFPPKEYLTRIGLLLW